MPKRIVGLFLISAMMAVIALFTTAEAAEMQEECSSVGRSCRTPDGWNIDLLTGFPKENSDRCPGKGNWEYRYQVCKPWTGGANCNAVGLTRVNLALPDCCPDEITLTKAIGCKEPLLTFPVGAGDSITKFERGDQFVYAARLPFWGPRIEERSFCANTPVLDQTSICLDRLLKPTLDCCRILGPTCQTSEPLQAEVSIIQGPVNFSITFNSKGQSDDVTCDDCEVADLTLKDLVLYIDGQIVGTVTWLPFDTPIQSTASPECTYVRMATGVVKKVCK